MYDHALSLTALPPSVAPPSPQRAATTAAPMRPDSSLLRPTAATVAHYDGDPYSLTRPHTTATATSPGAGTGTGNGHGYGAGKGAGEGEHTWSDK